MKRRSQPIRWLAIIAIAIASLPRTIQPTPAFACYNWSVGQRVGLKRSAEIREGPGVGFRAHTNVPEDNWLVDIIGGPRSADGQEWWDVSRRNLDGGGTGWVSKSQAAFNLCGGGGGGGGGSGGSAPPGYYFCSEEDQRCNFTGTKDVAYGANGAFFFRNGINNGIDCNNGTFGDPISGVRKACYIKDAQNSAPPQQGPPAGFVFCAEETQRCNFNGTGDVAYGASGRFNYRYGVANGIDCNNSVFGDPINGTRKACYVKVTSSQQPQPQPQPACQPGPNGVVLYEHINFQGACITLTADTSSLPTFNDQASSVRLVGSFVGRGITLFEHNDYKGASLAIFNDEPSLVSRGFNDRVSSLVMVVPQPPPAPQPQPQPQPSPSCFETRGCVYKQLGRSNRVIASANALQNQNCGSGNNWIVSYDISKHDEWKGVEFNRIRYWALGVGDSPAEIVEYKEGQLIKLCLGGGRYPLRWQVESSWVWLIGK